MLEQNEYTALVNSAAIQRRPESGLLSMTDSDRVDFLQRMTTNNIQALQAGQSTVTVLTSPTARVVFVFTVVAFANELWLLPAKGQAEQLERHLRGQIFFMDKVKIENQSQELSRIRLMGAQAEATLVQLGFDLSEESDGAYAERDGIVAVKQDRYDVPGYELIVPATECDTTIGNLTSAGAILLEDDSAYTARRVELGRPLSGHELTEEYNPLEAGLAWTCAEDKGCYTGQEIIARQITYDKVTKTLVGLRSDSLLEIGADATVNKRKVGVVTSVAHSPLLDAPVALAIIKRPHNEIGSNVVVYGIEAKVVALPFING